MNWASWPLAEISGFNVYYIGGNALFGIHPSDIGQNNVGLGCQVSGGLAAFQEFMGKMPQGGHFFYNLKCASLLAHQIEVDMAMVHDDFLPMFC